jgi:hypothetical protein
VRSQGKSCAVVGVWPGVRLVCGWWLGADEAAACGCEAISCRAEDQECVFSVTFVCRGRRRNLQNISIPFFKSCKKGASLS